MSKTNSEVRVSISSNFYSWQCPPSLSKFITSSEFLIEWCMFFRSLRATEFTWQCPSPLLWSIQVPGAISNFSTLYLQPGQWRLLGSAHHLFSKLFKFRVPYRFVIVHIFFWGNGDYLAVPISSLQIINSSYGCHIELFFFMSSPRAMKVTWHCQSLSCEVLCALSSCSSSYLLQGQWRLFGSAHLLSSNLFRFRVPYRVVPLHIVSWGNGGDLAVPISSSLIYSNSRCHIDLFLISSPGATEVTWQCPSPLF